MSSTDISMNITNVNSTNDNSTNVNNEPENIVINIQSQEYQYELLDKSGLYL